MCGKLELYRYPSAGGFKKKQEKNKGTRLKFLFLGETRCALRCSFSIVSSVSTVFIYYTYTLLMSLVQKSSQLF